MQKLKCLRCDALMQFVKREHVQLGKTTFLSGDWSNLWAGALDVAIFACPECGKLELYRGDFYEEQAELEQSGIAKTTCLTCGTKYDLDDPQCPRCRAKNPKW